MAGVTLKGKRISKRVVESVAKLDGEHPHTPKEVALEDGVTPSAIYKRRRRIECKLGGLMPRHETRGRKPKPLAAA